MQEEAVAAAVAQMGGSRGPNQSSASGSREGETDVRDVRKEEMTDFGG